MQKLTILMLTLLVSTSAYAQRGSARSSNDFSSPNRNSSVTGYLGFGQSAVNVGGDFEMSSSPDSGFGGYFFLLTDKKENGFYLRPQLITFGAHAKAHYRPGSWDIYVSPGFGVMLIDHNNVRTGADEDTTTIGPSMRIGALYNLNSQISVGLEHATFFNWFEDDVAGGQLEVANAVIRINL